MYAHGILFSKFNFGIQCYAGSDATYLERARICYDKCVRATFGPNPEKVSTEQMRKKLRILSFDSLIKMSDLAMLKKVIETGAPGNINHFFKFSNRARANGELQVILIPKTEKFRRTFLFRASRTWNWLPNEFKNLPFHQFQPQVKRFLLGDFNGPGGEPMSFLAFPNLLPNHSPPEAQ